MKSYRKELFFNIPSRRGFVNITPQVEEALRESGISEGLCLVKSRLNQGFPARNSRNDDPAFG
jgi:thiamine phosphate synthase YjbQ (UPF0047 family)